jgi:hypothetical protein
MNTPTETGSMNVVIVLAINVPVTHTSFGLRAAASHVV